MREEPFGSWTRQPRLFSEQALAALHDLNHRFLDLLGSHCGDWSRELGLPAEVTLQVAPLTAAERAAAANCPYALYDLRFHDDEHWRSCLSGGAQRRVADETVQADTANFVRLALFYAWHMASRPSLIAQLQLGMTEDTAAAFRSVTLNSLAALVATGARNLSPRWRTSAIFWRALTSAAARRDAASLRRIQLFGVQLAAATRLP